MEPVGRNRWQSALALPVSTGGNGRAAKVVLPAADEKLMARSGVDVRALLAVTTQRRRSEHASGCGGSSLVSRSGHSREPSVSYAYISRIESGPRQPSVKMLRKLAPKLSVTFASLETAR